MPKDSYFLKEALKLAEKAQGCTSPNPMVGSIIVKNNRIISKGYHRRAGLMHAEIEAIRHAKEDLKGSTIYINLEPCCHFGKTGPCVDEIIKAQIKKVIISTPDPNPRVGGKAIKKLKEAGLQVEAGQNKKDAQKLNEVFFKNMKKKSPFVIAKVAQSLDGKIATHKGLSKWITSPKARRAAKSLRDKYDCVLVGANTIIKDNPKLNGLRKIPYKAVISGSLNLPLNSYVFKKTPDKLIIFTSYKSRNKAAEIPKEVKVFFLKEKKGHLPLSKILKILYNLGIMSVFVEGGAKTLGEFFLRKLVDKIYFFISPKVIGGAKALSSIGAKGFTSLKKSPSIHDINISRIGADILISGYPKHV